MEKDPNSKILHTILIESLHNFFSSYFDASYFFELILHMKNALGIFHWIPISYIRYRFKLTLISVKLVQEEIIANLLQSYHAALGHALYYA